MIGVYLYRVQIVEYPKGALIADKHDPDYLYPDPDWRPEGWDPDEYWIDTYGRESSDFFWPSTYKEYRSRSTAVRRRNLIESYGAKCIIQRSAKIVWPEVGREYVR